MESNTKISIKKNGPLIISGKIPLEKIIPATDPKDNKIIPIEVTDTYALCRCGHSKNKPFCDGSHRAGAFNDEA